MLKKLDKCCFWGIVLFLFISCEKKETKEINKYIEEITIDDHAVESFISEYQTDDLQNFVFENVFVTDAESIIYDWDETLYDDKATVEFCLNDIEGRNFCLYHNIRKINNWDIRNSENYSEEWRIKDKEGLSIIWNYENGAILIMETESPKYSTKRGIRVGDSISKVIDAYENDSNIYEYNNELKNYETISKKENSIFGLYKLPVGISLNSGNFIDEEMMTILFYANGDIIEKIKITCIEE